MKVIDALEHDWKVGEKLWEVCFVYSRVIPAKHGYPVGVVEVEVENVERHKEYANEWEAVKIKLNGDFPADIKDNVTYSSTILDAMVEHQPVNDVYIHQNFCDYKYFSKAAAEASYKKEIKRWNECVDRYKVELGRKVDEAQKNLVEAERALEFARVECERDYEKYKIK